MAQTDLVFENPGMPAQSPQTHVFIIGVGHYRYGKGGSEPVTPDGDYIGQLTSPPASARALANWFIRDFRNDDRPLGSVALLLSEQAAASTYTPPRTALVPAPQACQVPVADHAQVKAAALAWIERLKRNKENMAVFYFCGHGMTWNSNTTMLLRDFGRDQNNPIAEAIAVDQVVETMKNCPAIYQAFFIDCCRTRQDDLLEGQAVIGTPAFFLSPYAKQHADVRRQAVYYATSDDRPAAGGKNRTSLFTEALMDGLSFVAAENDTGDWVVRTGRLVDAMTRLVALRPKSAGGTIQIPAPKWMHSFDFNNTKMPPEVRTYVTAKDPSKWGDLHLRCVRPSDNAELFNELTDSNKDPFAQWDLPLAQDLIIEANLPGGVTVTHQLSTGHPVRWVELGV
jgi:Caspase domain